MWTGLRFARSLKIRGNVSARLWNIRRKCCRQSEITRPYCALGPFKLVRSRLNRSIVLTRIRSMTDYDEPY